MRSLIAALVLVYALVSPVTAMVPHTISYQGRLTTPTGQPVADGLYLVRFRIYDQAAGGTVLWDNQYRSVSVQSGLFTYQLGDSTVLPPSLLDDTARYLGVTVGTDAEIVPRVKLGSVAYAFRALKADTAGVVNEIPDNSVTTGKIVDGAIVDADISPLAGISPSKIAGTVATLDANQTFTGDNIITGSLRLEDSLLHTRDSQIVIGTAADPDTYGDNILVFIHRNSNSATNQVGLWSDVMNASTGATFGLVGNVHSPAGVNSIPSGGAFYSSSDGDMRYGCFGRTDAATPFLTTGTSYGTMGIARNGAIAYGAFGSAVLAENVCGVYGSASEGAQMAYGVFGYAGSSATGHGIHGDASNNTTSFAGYFVGNVNVTGTLTKGGGAFRIDHPLDPENKYLQHSFVESPDMMNVYNGNVTLGAYGDAVVTLPDWFEALNKDFRYQLTCIGGFAPVFISQKIVGNQFRISGGTAGLEVSWMVTGIRRDAYAEANRIQVEMDKRPEEKGKYAHPEELGLDRNQGIDWKHRQQAEQTVTVPEQLKQ